LRYNQNATNSELEISEKRIMRTPHFVRLAEIDDRHFFTACRHGLVHLTWARTTLRLTRKEFREITRLLTPATDPDSPTAGRSGDVRFAYRPDDECELQIGSVVLLLSASEFQAFATTAQEALKHLTKLLSSGAWDKEEEAAEPPSDISERLRRNPFSEN
jgi:hypothetical protein